MQLHRQKIASGGEIIAFGDGACGRRHLRLAVAFGRHINYLIDAGVGRFDARVLEMNTLYYNVIRPRVWPSLARIEPELKRWAGIVVTLKTAWAALAI